MVRGCVSPYITFRFNAMITAVADSWVGTTAEALEAATASLSLDAQKRAARDAQKKAAKAEAAEAKQADRLAKSVVTIKRIERNKKKFVTAVVGLEAFGLELKKVRHPLIPFRTSPQGLCVNPSSTES